MLSEIKEQVSDKAKAVTQHCPLPSQCSKYGVHVTPVTSGPPSSLAELAQSTLLVPIYRSEH